MVLNLSHVPPFQWSLKTIPEMPTVAVNDTYIARQRASVKWLLSKAYNNHVPDNIQEPFYRDHEHQEHLKPQIVVGLGNATLYCQTLSNLYSDPNYQSLNHWSILQTLARKGVPVSESQEQPLTETVLIQTNPLRINAHMSVIESLMILYAKEISSGDRIPNAIRRICGHNVSIAGQTYEQCLLSWVSHACSALKKRIDQEIENGATDENGVRYQSPEVPPVRDFQDLCDGVCLALLISYYCPKVVPWTSVRINYLPAVEDSIHNVLLVSNFSQKHLPYSVFHMTPEDITYMRGSMKQNLVVLLADLFNLFEIHPAKCVCYPGMESQESDTSSVSSNEYGISYRRGLTCQPITPIPDLRSGLDSPTCSPSNRPPFQVIRSTSAVSMRRITPPKDYQHCSETNNYPTPTTTPVDEGFVVHRSKGIPTLSSVQEPLVPARLRQAKEKNNMESKADERGDSLPAGRPSNWEQHRRPSFAGRRSRRNSSSEDSQLTIENFGGSQDQLNMIDRNIERERKTSAASIGGYIEPVLPARSSLADARGSLQIGYDTDSGSEKQDRETEKTAMRRQTSLDNVSLRNIIHSSRKDLTDGEIIQNHLKQKSAYSQDADAVPKRKTSFANLPTNTTTWQQQSVLFNQSDHNDYVDETSKPLIDASKLSSIRLKLEEKRRNIEQEKRKMEIAMSKHQEKVGKAAFLQAINKKTTITYEFHKHLEHLKLEEIMGKAQTHSDVENKDHHSMDETSSSTSADGNETSSSMPSKSNASTQDDWEPQTEYQKRTPDLETTDIDKYQQSIAMMNSNLQDLQQDIHRLVTQQSQLQAQQLQTQQQMLQAQQISSMMQQDNRSFGAPQPPSEDMMAPQSISFIGEDDDQVDQIEMNIEILQPSSGRQGNNFIRKMQQQQQQLHQQQQQQQQQFYDENDVDVNLGRLNISSGNRTYRIPSPSRPLLNSNSFQDPQQQFQQNNQQQRQENNSINEKGFYISFDDQQPKRPKPPLRTKRSPKKEKSFDNIDKSEQHSQLDIQLDNKKEQKHNSIHSNIENNKSNTYNKLDPDTPIQLRQITELNQSPNNGNSIFNDYRRHLEDVTNQQSQQQLQQQQLQQAQQNMNNNNNNNNNNSSSRQPKENQALIIGNEISSLDPNSIDEMEKKKEKIMLLSLQRRQQQEEAKARKEIEAMQRREKEREKEDERARKKEEQSARRAAILEAHRLKKAVEEAEREGKTVDRELLIKHQLAQQQQLQQQQMQQQTQPRLRQQKMTRPRPKTIHVETGSVDISEASSISSRGKKGSSSNLTGYGQLSSNSMRRDYYRGSQDSLAVRESPDEYPSTSSTPIGRRGSYKNSREPTLERGRTLSRISIAKGSSLNFRGRKSNSLMNLCDTDSGIGRATPPRRAPSPGMGPSSSSSSAGRHLPSPSGPGSLPPGLMTKRRIFDDGSSDISAASSMMEYSGPKLYKQPAAKSNRGIILNAVEYCVFPGAVNRDAKQKVLEKIARSEAKHFLILFRDAGCQFRALYSYWPENEQVLKLYGTGPSQVDEVMFDKFFKYNSGGKCFSQVHTKHLTVTIDAFTIHNSLWQGKKVNLPSKKDMALVI
ncbi:patronin isoform X28 [Condylostylus longicornis]|uniref:patronin isoform X28 n=1 Tax=Condylostylus longicornis TaxID=2530218 RepID=UPI00244DB693|nr:patronin isoform X28 [Condylostylus longicornis]